MSFLVAVAIIVLFWGRGRLVTACLWIACGVLLLSVASDVFFTVWRVFEDRPHVLTAIAAVDVAADRMRDAAINLAVACFLFQWFLDQIKRPWA